MKFLNMGEGTLPTLLNFLKLTLPILGFDTYSFKDLKKCVAFFLPLQYPLF